MSGRPSEEAEMDALQTWWVTGAHTPQERMVHANIEYQLDCIRFGNCPRWHRTFWDHISHALGRHRPEAGEIPTLFELVQRDHEEYPELYRACASRYHS